MPTALLVVTPIPSAGFLDRHLMGLLFLPFLQAVMDGERRVGGLVCPAPAYRPTDRPTDLALSTLRATLREEGQRAAERRGGMGSGGGIFASAAATAQHHHSTEGTTTAAEAEAEAEAERSDEQGGAFPILFSLPPSWGSDVCPQRPLSPPLGGVGGHDRRRSPLLPLVA